MDMHSREQYLDRVREDYRKADKKGKTRLLNEARKRTRLNRKVLIGKLAHPAVEKRKKKRGPRQATCASHCRVSGESARVDLSPTAEAYRREYPKESALGLSYTPSSSAHPRISRLPSARLGGAVFLGARRTTLGCKFRSRQDLT